MLRTLKCNRKRVKFKNTKSNYPTFVHRNAHSPSVHSPLQIYVMIKTFGTHHNRAVHLSLNSCRKYQASIKEKFIYIEDEIKLHAYNVSVLVTQSIAGVIEIKSVERIQKDI